METWSPRKTLSTTPPIGSHKPITISVGKHVGMHHVVFPLIRIGMTGVAVDGLGNLNKFIVRITQRTGVAETMRGLYTTIVKEVQLSFVVKIRIAH
jgi:hypothetical protein